MDSEGEGEGGKIWENGIERKYQKKKSIKDLCIDVNEGFRPIVLFSGKVSDCFFIQLILTS